MPTDLGSHHRPCHWNRELAVGVAAVSTTPNVAFESASKNAQVGDLGHYLGFGVGLFTLTALTLGLIRWAGVGLGMFPLWAMVRAVVQLTVVALLLRGILAVPWTVALFLVLM